MHVERWELQDVLNYLVTPVQTQGGSYARGTKTRDERKSLKSALTQLGLYQMWKASQSGSATTFQLPVVAMCDMSEEAVNYLLGVMTDMNNRDSISLIDFEERLEELKLGYYEVPDEAVARAALPPTPETPSEPVAAPAAA
jgi:hypothetical protein